MASWDQAVRLDVEQLNRLLRGPQGPVTRRMMVLGEQVRQEAKRQVGKDTRKLERSIVKRVVQRGKGAQVEVGSEMPYAGYHHEGTRAHVIRGKPRLVFFWPKVGRVVAFTSVHHPGTKPNRYLTDSLARVMARARGGRT